MDFDKPKVYGDTSITDGLVLNQSLTGQHLANSGEAQLKKSPCICTFVGLAQTFLRFVYQSFAGKRKTLHRAPKPTHIEENNLIHRCSSLL